MKFVVSAKRFAATLRSVMPAVSPRATLPVLGGIRIDASKKSITLQATDLEMSARCVIREEITVEQPGSIVAPAKALSKAVRSMQDDEITFEAEDADGKPRLVIASGGRRVALECYPSEDFPKLPDDARFDTVGSAEASILSEALIRAAMCASSDEARPALTTVGLFARRGKKELDVVATDSYRLGALRVLLNEAAASDSALLVPARAVRAFAKDLRKELGDVTIGIDRRESASTVRFGFGSSVWLMRLVEGEFPNWRQLLPAEGLGGRLDVGARELGSALKAVSSISTNRGTPVRLQLGESCSIELAEQNSGSVRETLATASYVSDGAGDLEIAFNPEYLADAVRFCGEDRVQVSVRDGLKPALFGEPDARYLLMPVRIS